MNFGKSGGDGEDLYITIVRGNTSNDSLMLTPADTGRAYQDYKVYWIIKNGSNVQSFFITQKKGSRQIFKLYDRPAWPLHVKESRATVMKNADIGSIYDYAIHWKDTTGKKHTFDPKIAVMSSSKNDLDILFYILYFAVALSFIVFRKKFLYKT